MLLYQYLDGSRVGVTHLPVMSMWSKISCHIPMQSNSPRPNLSMVSIHCPLVPWSFYCVGNPPRFLPLSVDFTPNIADLSPTSHLSLCRVGIVNTHLEDCLYLSLQCDEQRFCFLGECTEDSERQMQNRLLSCFVTSDVSPEKKAKWTTHQFSTDHEKLLHPYLPIILGLQVDPTPPLPGTWVLRVWSHSRHCTFSTLR